MAKGLPVEQSISSVGSPMPMADDKMTVSVNRSSAVADELRWKLVMHNALESIPLALVVFLVASFSGSNRNVNAILTAVYTAARILHTITYINKLALARMQFSGHFKY